MSIFEEENGNVLIFYCTIQTLDGNPLFQLNRFRLAQLYLFNILTAQKEISAVSLVLFIGTAGMGLAVSLKKTQ